MKNAITILLALLITWHLNGQSKYWQQKVDFTIDVTLNDKEHTLNAFEKIAYTNNSPDTLHFIWFHIWPNAYKNDKTAFSDQLLENGNTDFYFSNKENKGYINRLDFKVNNITAAVEDHPQHIDIVKVILPTPLPPGQTITISTPFHVKLPFNYSRGGHDGESYQVTQWYPKPAVYDRNGWHPMPYLDQGEFYSEFGDFDVRITVPENYVVAATGELQDREEIEWRGTRSEFTWEPIVTKTKIKGGGVKKTTQLYPTSSSSTKSIRFTQKNVHDFAWFADKRFIVKRDTCILPGGKTISVQSFYTPEEKNLWEPSIEYLKQAVRFYSENVGEYPYNVVAVVQGPKSFGGGMEYPTITVISPSESTQSLAMTITHEVGHNWFYGILASNERTNPWMDEGINTYYDRKFERMKFGFISNLDSALLATKIIQKTDQPIAINSEAFSETNYYLTAYLKTALWLEYVEAQIGSQEFSNAMKEYFNEWKFKHPQPADFKASLEKSTGQDLDSLFSLLNQKGQLPVKNENSFFVTSLLRNPHIGNWWANKVRSHNHTLSIGPSLGYNTSDRFMLGLLLTNYGLPPSKFRYLFTPMYAFGSKTLTGYGKVNYSFFQDRGIRNIELFVNAARFTQDVFVDSTGKKYFYDFNKLVPGITMKLREKNPRSTRLRWFQWKSYFINEEQFDFITDTVIAGIDTTITSRYGTKNQNTVLNQLRFVIEDTRKLYPYAAEFKVEQGKEFWRLGFTGNYFFNYPKEGGLDLRIFAGKFIYAGSKTFSKELNTDRYHLNMTGPNGYEDYTYSDPFIGRNEFEGVTSQQLMVRDGGFKMRTELLAEKVGKTDDWLAAINLSSSIPSKINPLSLLPIKIPLKVFLDMGTYAEAWDQDSELDKILFEAGFHIPIMKETINIYIPLIYSSIYKEYVQSALPQEGRFWRKISFSINLSNFKPGKFSFTPVELW